MHRNVTSSPRRPARAPAQARPVERLESRTLFAAAHVTSVITDNRGEVNITFDQPLDPTTVKTTTVQVHTSGPDGLFGTADDVKIVGRVKTKVNNRRIWWRPADVVPFAAGTTYSVKVSSKFVKDAQGNRIDGEFNGPGIVGGDGNPGGDVFFLSKRDKGTAPVARFTTVEGNIDVSLDTVNTPLTYGNFLHYANSGLWDYTFFHRSEPGFIVQGGGFNVNLTNNTVGTIPEAAQVKNEFHTSNTRGTIAMAKIPATDQNGNPIPGGGPDSATDQWFFNLADNSTNLDGQNGGFTVFGAIKGAGGLAAADAVAGLPRVDYTSKADSGTSPFGAMDHTPVVNPDSTPATLNPLADLVIIRRIAILNKVVAYTFT